MKAKEVVVHDAVDGREPRLLSSWLVGRHGEMVDDEGWRRKRGQGARRVPADGGGARRLTIVTAPWQAWSVEGLGLARTRLEPAMGHGMGNGTAVGCAMGLGVSPWD